MKKIIEGKRYDTDTADLIGRAERCHGSFSDWDAGLFRTKNGAYFLAGEGGPASPYAAPSGERGTQSGSKIIPLTLEEARDWAEHNLETEVVEAAFGGNIEDA